MTHITIHLTTYLCADIVKQYPKGSIVVVLLGTLKLFIPPSHFIEVDSDRRRVCCWSAYYHCSVIIDPNSTKRSIPKSVILLFVKAFRASLRIYLSIPPSARIFQYESIVLKKLIKLVILCMDFKEVIICDNNKYVRMDGLILGTKKK